MSRLTTAFLLLLATAPVAEAQSAKVGDLAIDGVWTRATPPGAPTAAAYLTITNAGTTADRLVGVATAAATKGEVHEMAVANGIMTMRAVAGGLAIEPGAKVELKPGGLHLMLVGLKQPLRQGNTIALTLTFEKAGSVTLDAAVQPIGAAGPAHQHGQ
jgi:hypothetical protein